MKIYIISIVSALIFTGLLFFQNCSGQFEPIRENINFSSSTKGDPSIGRVEPDKVEALPEITEPDKEEEPVVPVEEEKIPIVEKPEEVKPVEPENKIILQTGTLYIEKGFDGPTITLAGDSICRIKDTSAFTGLVEKERVWMLEVYKQYSIASRDLIPVCKGGEEKTESTKPVVEAPKVEEPEVSENKITLQTGAQYIQKGFVGPVITVIGGSICTVKDKTQFKEIKEQEESWMKSVYAQYSIVDISKIKICESSGQVALSKLDTASDEFTPKDFVASLASNNWTEFNWLMNENIKSKVDYFKIYRNGVELARVNKSYDNKIDEVKWKTNTYNDCNYTRDKSCQQSERQPKPGSEYTYQISAVSAGKESSKSEELKIKFPLFTGPELSKEGYKLAWSDEFNSKQLDPNKWNTKLPWKDPHQIINGEKQYFVNIQEDPNFGYNPFVLTGDRLIIQGLRTPDNLKIKAKNQPFLSGALTTVGKYNFTYGYAEAKIKLSNTMGSLSTFFLLNSKYNLFDKEDPGNEHEIDIVEYLAQLPKAAFQTYHYHRKTFEGERITNSSPTMATLAPNDANYYDDFHTFGTKWEPGLIIWYIDGQEVKRISGPAVGWDDVSIFMYLVLGSEWAVTPPADAVFPAKLEIDYIRVYQKQ